jgi:hypothetical protein
MGRCIGAKVVEEEEGVVQLRVMKAEGPAKMDACPLDGRYTGKGTGN